MIGTILSWVAGSGISAIGDQLRQAYDMRLRAENDSTKLEADALINQLNARRDVLVAESRDRRTNWIRPALVIPFIIYDFKVVVWDITLGLGTTPPMPAEFWNLQAIVFGFYFLGRPFEKIFQKRL